MPVDFFWWKLLPQILLILPAVISGFVLFYLLAENPLFWQFVRWCISTTIISSPALAYPAMIFWESNFDPIHAWNIIRLRLEFHAPVLLSIIGFGLFLSLLLRFVVFPHYIWPIRFSSPRWKDSGGFDRSRMLVDLLQTHRLLYLDANTIVTLLGEPDRKEHGVFIYQLGRFESLRLAFSHDYRVMEVIARRFGH